MSEKDKIISVDDYYGVPTGHVPRMTYEMSESTTVGKTELDTQPQTFTILPHTGHHYDLNKSITYPTQPTLTSKPQTFAIPPATNSTSRIIGKRPEHNHYFKNVEHLKTIDVYRVLQLFNVTDPCIQHAIKKLLVAGGRGAGKDLDKDIKEAIDSLKRYQEIKNEDYTHA